MKAIYKYTLDQMFGNHQVSMPKRATILTAQNQSDELRVWAEVEVGAYDNNLRNFAVCATGTMVPTDGSKYIGTVQIRDLVYHIYDIGE